MAFAIGNFAYVKCAISRCPGSGDSFIISIIGFVLENSGHISLNIVAFVTNSPAGALL
jgi:hypothetical protein